MARYNSLTERLIHNSHRDKHCCVWDGYCQKTHAEIPGTPGAYGRINLQRAGRSLKFPVHRVAKVLEEILLLMKDFDFYDLTHKQIFFDLYQAYSLANLSIDHLCKNTLCINPRHLEWVRLSKNTQRKKWLKSKRVNRIKKQHYGKTRHYQAITISGNVLEWIQKIQCRVYKTK